MRFILVGTLNALITVLIVWLMMDKLGCNYIATNITAYVIAQINNKFRREIPLFLIAFGCAYCSQFLALLIMVEIFDLNEYLAQFLGLFIYGAVNYMMNKKITFQLTP